MSGTTGDGPGDETLDAALPAALPGARIALLGGSFNPPHIGHALLAHAVLSVADVDAVWLLPTAQHPFGKDLAPFEDRVAMCRLAFRQLGGAATVVEVEEKLPAPNFTVQTLRAIKRLRPGVELLWVAGSDILGELHLWREHEALLEMCELFLVPRPGFPDEGRAQLAFALPDISSTDLRARLAKHESVAGAVDRRVSAYLAQHRLYGTGS